MYPSISDETMSYPTPSAPPQQPPKGNNTLATYLDTSANHRNNNVSDVASSHSPRPWSTGLCDCCSDFSSCCLTCWCPCITFGRVAEIVDRGTTSCGVSGALYALIMCVTGCSCIYSCFYRSKLRGQYFLDESPCNDCCVHCCFEQCALCQEYRELKNQGFNMSLGWYGNLERRKRGIATPPAVQDGMKR